MNYASKCSGRQTQRSVQKGAAKHCQTKAYCPDPAFGAPCPALELQQLWTSLQISHGKRAENIKTHSKLSDPRWKMHSSPITGNGLTVSQQDLFKYKCRHGSWPSAPPSRQFLYPKGHFATTLSRPFSTTQCSMSCHSILGPKARWNSGSHQENSINLNSSCPSFITNCCFLRCCPFPITKKSDLRTCAWEKFEVGIEAQEGAVLQDVMLIKFTHEESEWIQMVRRHSTNGFPIIAIPKSTSTMRLHRHVMP